MRRKKEELIPIHYNLFLPFKLTECACQAEQNFPNKLGNKNSLCNIWVEYFYCNHFVRSEMIISTPDK